MEVIDDETVAVLVELTGNQSLQMIFRTITNDCKCRSSSPSVYSGLENVGRLQMNLILHFLSSLKIFPSPSLKGKLIKFGDGFDGVLDKTSKIINSIGFGGILTFG